MTTLTEGAHAGEFLVSESEKTRSRDAIVVASGQNLAAGTVLGKKAGAATSATGAAVAGNTGNGTVGSVAIGKARQPGAYRLVCIEPAADGGTFSLEGPDGKTIGTAKVGLAYTGDGPAFTIADGGTDFVAGDAFVVTVVGESVKYAVYDPTATDGTQFAAGILYASVDATSADTAGVAIVRSAEVNSSELTWFSGATSAQKSAGLEQLATLGIIGR